MRSVQPRSRRGGRGAAEHVVVDPAGARSVSQRLTTACAPWRRAHALRAPVGLVARRAPSRVRTQTTSTESNRKVQACRPPCEGSAGRRREGCGGTAVRGATGHPRANGDSPRGRRSAPRRMVCQRWSSSRVAPAVSLIWGRARRRGDATARPAPALRHSNLAWISEEIPVHAPVTQHTTYHGQRNQSENMPPVLVDPNEWASLHQIAIRISSSAGSEQLDAHGRCGEAQIRSPPQSPRSGSGPVRARRDGPDKSPRPDPSWSSAGSEATARLTCSNLNRRGAVGRRLTRTGWFAIRRRWACAKKAVPPPTGRGRRDGVRRSRCRGTGLGSRGVRMIPKISWPRGARERREDRRRGRRRMHTAGMLASVSELARLQRRRSEPRGDVQKKRTSSIPKIHGGPVARRMCSQLACVNVE